MTILFPAVSQHVEFPFNRVDPHDLSRCPSPGSHGTPEGPIRGIEIIMPPSRAFRPPQEFLIVIQEHDGLHPVVDIRLTRLMQNHGYLSGISIHLTEVQLVTGTFGTLNVEIMVVGRHVK